MGLCLARRFLLAFQHPATPQPYLPEKLLNFFLSMRLRTLGSSIFAISFLFNYFRTLEAKIPGGGAAFHPHTSTIT